MKKLILATMLMFGSFAFSQYYQDTYPDYYGNEYYDSQYSYPDDYYYNYPTDYYPEDYYQNYYNDYRNSFVNINWNGFFRNYRLSPWQIQAIIDLNNRFPSFIAWNSYYGMNPDRWYYDRFYALERILGPQVFVVYQKNYYRGLSPIVYFQNYRTNYYVVNFHIRPKYRNVDIVRYRVDRYNLNDTWKSTRNVAMIDTKASSIRNASGVRNQSMINDNANNNIRNSSSVRNQTSIAENTGNIRSGSSGIRNQSPMIDESSNIRSGSSGVRNQSMQENSSNVRSNVRNQNMPSESFPTGGVRNNPVRNTESVRSSGMEMRSNTRMSSPSFETRSSGGRESQRDNAGGMRSSNSGTSRGR